MLAVAVLWQSRLVNAGGLVAVSAQKIYLSRLRLLHTYLRWSIHIKGGMCALARMQLVATPG